MSQSMVFDEKGNLFSIGSVVSEDLPAGYTVQPISDADAQAVGEGYLTWDGTKLAPTGRPSKEELAQAEINRKTIVGQADTALTQLQQIINSPAPNVANIAQANAALGQLTTAVQTMAKVQRQTIRVLFDKLDGST